MEALEKSSRCKSTYNNVHLLLISAFYLQTEFCAFVVLDGKFVFLVDFASGSDWTQIFTNDAHSK